MDKINQKPKIKPFLIGKELKTNNLRQTAARRASGLDGGADPGTGVDVSLGASWMSGGIRTSSDFILYHYIL